MPRAIGDFLILRAVRESGGTALAVSDRAMVDGMLRGSAASKASAPRPKAAPRFAARCDAARRRRSRSGAWTTSVVLFNTGGATRSHLDVLHRASKV